MNRLKIILILASLIFNAYAYSQDLETRDNNFLAFGFKYGLNFTAGDMADRFGSNNAASISLDLFSNKFNGVFSLEYAFIFGDNVREDALASIRLDNGRILGNNGAYADIFLRQRGAYIGIAASKVVLPMKKNPKSGLSIGLGAGWLQHRIRFQDDLQNVPQVSGEYSKGYDRHTTGPYLKQTFEFTNIGRNRSLNYSIGFFILEGFTKNRRINFDTGMQNTNSRIDIIWGINAKWYIPFKDYTPPGEIFY